MTFPSRWCFGVCYDKIIAIIIRRKKVRKKFESKSRSPNFKWSVAVFGTCNLGSLTSSVSEQLLVVPRDNGQQLQSTLTCLAEEALGTNMKWSVLIQSITLSGSASSCKNNLLIPQSWDLVTCQIHAVQFKPLFYIVIAKESPGGRCNLSWGCTALFHAQRSHVCLQSQGCWNAPDSGQCQQAMRGCIENSSENGITRRLLSSDFWLLTDASVFWPSAHK